jgi:hypothetical protein
MRTAAMILNREIPRLAAITPRVNHTPGYITVNELNVESRPLHG